MTLNQEARLAEIKAWRARMSVHPDLQHIDREEAGISLTDDGPDGTGTISVFQHTLDDYDFLLQLADAERAVVEAARVFASDFTYADLMGAHAGAVLIEELDVLRSALAALESP